MFNPIDSIADALKAGAQAFDSLGSATSNVIKEASRGYAQKDGETDEAYRMRLEFLEKKANIRQENKNTRQENKSKRQENKAQEKLAHKELKVFKRQEKKEIKSLAKQDKIQGKDDR